ncbi:MAG: hypothetical protein QJR08_02070 [Bacillota bacterium]|nr:hypothetical protein [Bacillota bacterium]
MPHMSVAAWQAFSLWYLASAAVVVFGLFTAVVVRGMRRQAPQFELIRGGRTVPASPDPGRERRKRRKAWPARGPARGEGS